LALFCWAVRKAAEHEDLRQLENIERIFGPIVPDNLKPLQQLELAFMG
jgi:hypothetical protein